MGHISNSVLQGDGEGWGHPQPEVITGQRPGGCGAGTKTEGLCFQTRWEEETYSSKSHPFPPFIIKNYKRCEVFGQKKKKMLSKFYSNFCFKQYKLHECATCRGESKGSSEMLLFGYLSSKIIRHFFFPFVTSYILYNF